jgi:outer membrane protein assembly factor BamA
MTAKISRVLLVAAIAPTFTSRHGVAQIDSNVLQPRPIYHPNPDYFEEAKTISTTIQPCAHTLVPIDQATTAPVTLVTVANVTFEGATQVPIEEQERIIASITSRQFKGAPEAAKVSALELVREAWQERGFLKVQIYGDSRELTSNPITSRITLAIDIDEGQQYRLAGITFTGNKAITDAPMLRKQFPIKDGEIFSRKKVAQGLENLKKEYEVRGYPNFTSMPEPDFDEGERTVRFDIVMDEGNQFVVSAINLIGENENILAQASQDLHLKIGKVYNRNLLDLFAEKHPFGTGRNSLSRFLFNEREGSVAITLDLRQCHTP